MNNPRRKAGGYWLLGAALLLAGPTQAQQIPAELVGQWEAYQIGFALSSTVPDSVRDRLNDPATADLNLALMDGSAHLRIVFRADGGYLFTVTRGEEVVQRETGTYSVAHGRLQASSPGSLNGSSFHDQQIRRLSRRVLILAFPVGEYMPGVEEEVEYKRAK